MTTFDHQEDYERQPHNKQKCMPPGPATVLQPSQRRQTYSGVLHVEIDVLVADEVVSLYVDWRGRRSER